LTGKLLGHTQLQTAARYVHLVQGSIQNAAARIGQHPADHLLYAHVVQQPLVSDSADNDLLKLSAGKAAVSPEDAYTASTSCLPLL
jgi:hypothetical protein